MSKYIFKSLLFLGSLLIGFTCFANDSLGVKLFSHAERLNDKEAVLYIKALIQPGVKLYSIMPKNTDDVASTFQFDSTVQKMRNGNLLEKGSVQSEKDDVLGYEVNFFTDSVVWEQKFNLSAPDSILLKAMANLFVKKAGEYIPGEETIRVWAPAVSLREMVQNTSAVTNTVAEKSLWWIFLTAFGGGLLALLTPCVYSMIPITVSFFTKRSKSVAEGKKNALLYAVSIVIIFTLLGFLITVIFGPAALNQL
ncbi:MAG TPA: cytochrome c biogenesis protein CcdA, partial [Ferruginibacter sp.]|nr:cytochrome c biogenesis protein CcdA [Ferruginibacter sp.]